MPTYGERPRPWQESAFRWRPERYAIISTRNRGVDSAGFPVYPKRLVRTLVHEFNHSYVNDLLNAHAHRFARSGPAVFAAVAEPMRAQGYREWKVVLSEALVDAAVARYVRAYQGPGFGARLRRR